MRFVNNFIVFFTVYILIIHCVEESIVIRCAVVELVEVSIFVCGRLGGDLVDPRAGGWFQAEPREGSPPVVVVTTAGGGVLVGSRTSPLVSGLVVVGAVVGAA